MRSDMQAAPFVSYGGAVGPHSVQQVGCDSYGLPVRSLIGSISALGRDIGAGPYDDFIQIDAPVNKGNSGGPSFDMDGNVIGVNTAIFSPSGSSVGIAFDILADTAKRVITQLREKGSARKPEDAAVCHGPAVGEIGDSDSSPLARNVRRTGDGRRPGRRPRR